MKLDMETDDLDVRVEVIPLIDVIFCILIFFILATVSLARLEGLNVDLPQAETATAQFGDTLPVEIDVQGQIKVQDTPITPQQLEQFLASYVRQNPQGIVVLQADKLVSYGQVAQVIDILQRVGGNRIALGASQTPVSPADLNPGGFQSAPLPTEPEPLQPQPPFNTPNDQGLGTEVPPSDLASPPAPAVPDAPAPAN